MGDSILHYKVRINMPVSFPGRSLFGPDGEDVPSGLMRPNFNFSVSLLFMDSLSFRLMCKPDSYQRSRPASGRLEPERWRL